MVGMTWGFDRCYQYLQILVSSVAACYRSLCMLLFVHLQQEHLYFLMVQEVSVYVHVCVTASTINHDQP